MIRQKISSAAGAVRRWCRRHREGLRSLLLVLLVCALIGQSGALWLRVMTRSNTSNGLLQTAVTELFQQEIETDNTTAALPIRFAVRGENGLYGIQYNTDGLKTAYETTADVWAQAWKQMDDWKPATLEEYRTALQQNMMLMEYDGSVPLYLLAGWLDGTLPTQTAQNCAGVIALCRDAEGSYTLYLRERETNSLLCAVTTVDDAVFDAAAKQFEPNDCTLAADEDSAAVSPDLLYFAGGEVFDVLSFGAYDGSEGIEDLLDTFGLDADAAMTAAYTADGVTSYVSGDSTIRLTEDGSMRYDAHGSLRAAPARGTDQLLQDVQLGYELTSAALEAIDCGATAVLTDAYTNTDTGRYIAVFGLQIGGVPVDNAITGYFARYEFEDGALIHANLALRTCQTTGETIAVMPEKQAAAALESTADAVLSLRYVDRAVGTNSSWENLYDAAQTGESTETDLWDAENTNDTQDTAWNDTESQTDSGSLQTENTQQTAWYDSTGTPVSPKWYALQYHSTDSGPAKTETVLSPEEIIVVRADFDRMIQKGGAS